MGSRLALTLCVATLIASEFMPVSLLTPIAADLALTEGRVGQAIAVSGILAVLTSLLIASATRGIDRRIVLLALTLLMMASGVLVAFAPNGLTSWPVLGWLSLHNLNAAFAPNVKLQNESVDLLKIIGGNWYHVGRLADILGEELGLEENGQKRIITAEALARVKQRFAT